MAMSNNERDAVAIYDYLLTASARLSMHSDEVVAMVLAFVDQSGAEPRLMAALREFILAELLKQHGATKELCLAIASLLEADNPRFNQWHFMAACGLRKPPP